jgi:dienelactone hydrolase
MALSGWIEQAGERIGAGGAELKLALRVTIAGVLAYAITRFFHMPQGYWAVITAVVVMQASVGGSLKAAMERFSGTLAGALYGGVIAAFLPHGSALTLGFAIIVALFPLAVLAAVKPAFRVAPITSLIMLLPPTGQAIGPLASVVDRVLEITLGNIVGVLVAVFVLPARAHTLMTEAAAKVVSLNAELVSVFIDELTAGPTGRQTLQKIHPQIRSALKKAEAAAEEAARERRTHLTEAPDPEPLIRTLYRVRHDLVMIGRAASSPLPAPVLDRLRPSLMALHQAASALLLNLAEALRQRTRPPDSEAFRTALDAFTSGAEALRADALVRGLPGKAFGQIFALGFAFEQFQKNLSDLLARTDELASGRTKAAPGVDVPAARTSRSASMWLLTLILGITLLYAGLVLVTALFQTRMLFPAHMAAANRPPLPPSAERIELTTPDGQRLVGTRLGNSSGTKPLLLGFGGNAWNADAVALTLHGLFPDHEVTAFHYRGYPPSGGTPSAEALFADALTIFDHLQQQHHRDVVAVGFSIGSGVAAYLAHRRTLAGLILVTPFDSLKALAREHFSWAPTGLLLRHHMPTIDLVKDRRTPTALITAGRDTIVPARRSAPLRSAIPNLVLDRTIVDAGHNDLYDHRAFVAAMREAVTEFEKAAPHNPQ